MTPGTIENLLREAERSEKANLDPIVAFALRWIAWEAIRIRVLVVAARLCGWKMQEAKSKIGRRRISSNKQFARCLSDLSGFKIDNQLKSNAAKVWKATNRIEALRHRLFHGYDRPPQDCLLPASAALARFVELSECIFADIPIKGPDGIKRPLGDPMRLRPATGLGINQFRDKSDLDLLLNKNLELSDKKSKLPSALEAERWTKLL